LHIDETLILLSTTIVTAEKGQPLEIIA